MDIIINKLLLFDLRDTNPKQSSFHHCTALFSLTSMPIVFLLCTIYSQSFQVSHSSCLIQMYSRLRYANNTECFISFMEISVISKPCFYQQMTIVRCFHYSARFIPLRVNTKNKHFIMGEIDRRDKMSKGVKSIRFTLYPFASTTNQKHSFLNV